MHRKFTSKNSEDQEDVAVGGRIILEVLLDVQNMRLWTGFNLLRSVTSGNKVSGSVTCGKFIA